MNLLTRMGRRGRGRSSDKPAWWSPSLLIVLLLAGAGGLPAQTLARPGWRGSGLHAEPWWRNGVFYPMDPHAGGQDGDASGFKRVTAQLETLRSLGVDGICLESILPPADKASAKDASQAGLSPLDPAAGTMEDFEELIVQASRLKMRVLLTVPIETPELGSVARFWLSRGVAGIRLVSGAGAVGAGDAARVEEVRKIAEGLAGQRVVIAPAGARLAAEAAPRRRRRRHRRTRASAAAASVASVYGAGVLTEVALDLSGQDAGVLRRGLESAEALQRGGAAVMLRDSSLDHSGAGTAAGPEIEGDGSAMEWRIETMLVGMRTAAMLPRNDGFELPAEESAEGADRASGPAGGSAVETRQELSAQWIRALAALHHGNAAMRSGRVAMLDHDREQALAWVRRPAGVGGTSRPVVVICNLLPQPLRLSLSGDLQALGLRQRRLRTLLRSDQTTQGRTVDPAEGLLPVDGVIVPANGIYVGELVPGGGG